MLLFRITLALLLLLVLSACGGGGFTPQPGPYSGEFLVSDQAIGTFTLTVSGNMLGGTGMLTHNAQPVTVTITALINGTTVTGTVSNASLGGGAFTGQFASQQGLTGDFTYTDAGEISTTTGTWRATLD